MLILNSVFNFYIVFVISFRFIFVFSWAYDLGIFFCCSLFIFIECFFVSYLNSLEFFMKGMIVLLSSMSGSSSR